MADGIIKFPFRITPQGNAATVPYGSDDEVDQIIVAIVLTQLGERPLTPLFGVPDTAFAGLHTGDIQVCLDAFGPDGVDVDEVRLDYRSETVAMADIRWSRTDTEEER